MLFLTRVYVTLKPVVNDPQGITIRGALHSLGFAGVADVRAGKYLEVRLDAANEDEAATAVTAMCQQLLASPVLEEFRFEIEASGETR